MRANPRVLLVLTSHGRIADGEAPTGVWFEELATPYYALIDAGVQVDIVSVGGGEVPIDPKSVEPAGQNVASVERFMADAAAMHSIRASRAIAEVADAEYDAVFLPGGHGTMFDLPDSEVLASLIGRMWNSGRVVAAVCHGPAGLVNATDAAGKPIVADRRVTGFTNGEEEAVGLTTAMPFLLEDRLKALGGRYESVADFQPFAIRDGNLVTGQNPASSEEAARLTLEALRDGARLNAAG